MNIRTMELPAGVRAAVLRLVAGIEVSESVQGVNMASQHAGGFVLGLETAGAFRQDIIEALYIGFETIADERTRLLSEI